MPGDSPFPLDVRGNSRQLNQHRGKPCISGSFILEKCPQLSAVHLRVGNGHNVTNQYFVTREYLSRATHHALAHLRVLGATLIQSRRVSIRKPPNLHLIVETTQVLDISVR